MAIAKALVLNLLLIGHPVFRTRGLVSAAASIAAALADHLIS
jgi:hypothetical protein